MTKLITITVKTIYSLRREEERREEVVLQYSSTEDRSQQSEGIAPQDDSSSHLVAIQPKGFLKSVK